MNIQYNDKEQNYKNITAQYPDVFNNRVTKKSMVLVKIVRHLHQHNSTECLKRYLKK